MNIDEQIERAAKTIRDSEAVLITAGAGMGVDSGLPDFRGNEGFWKAYPPIARLGISFVEMANPEWFFRNPALAWAFYGHRLNLYRQTTPHAGYDQLLEKAECLDGKYFVFTSNVDGQFQMAGYDPDCIEECHGSIHHFQCTKPCGNHIWDAADTRVEVDEERFEAGSPHPVCPHCGGIARPNILMFGDWTWVQHRTAGQSERLSKWLRQTALDKRQLAVIEMGAGQAVPTVRYQSEQTAYTHGATLIRINPRDHQVPHGGHVAVPLGAQEGISRILDAL